MRCGAASTSGNRGGFEQVEVEGVLSDKVKRHLEAPIRADTHSTALPAFDITELEPFR